MAVRLHHQQANINEGFLAGPNKRIINTYALASMKIDGVLLNCHYSSLPAILHAHNDRLSLYIRHSDNARQVHMQVVQLRLIFFCT